MFDCLPELFLRTKCRGAKDPVQRFQKGDVLCICGRSIFTFHKVGQTLQPISLASVQTICLALTPARDMTELKSAPQRHPQVAQVGKRESQDQADRIC